MNWSPRKQLGWCFSFWANSSAGTVHCSAVITAQTARLVLTFSASSSADAYFQCKQLGWYTVVNLSQHKQLGWCFLFSVQTARLVHCSEVITAQTAPLVLTFSASSSADAYFQCKQLGWYTVVNLSQHKQFGWCFILSVQTARLVHCSEVITAQTAPLVLTFSASSSADTL